jgi:Glyoxalase/Bleomycin resistance protein/Dioxygenase superfamily
MSRPDIPSTAPQAGQERLGYAHLAMSVGSESAVDALTMRLVNDGYQRLDGPRRTGDGYYESVVLDPEGNRIEITALITGRPLYARRGGLKGAGGSSTDSKIAANIERGF